MKNLIINLFYLSILTNSCLSQNNKLKSKRDVDSAEYLIKNNLVYSSTLNDSSQQRLKRALNYINKAIELDSLNTAAYQDKLTILENLGKGFDPAIMSKILQLHSFAEGYIALGGYYESLNKFDSAKKEYNKARLLYLKKSDNDSRTGNLIYVEFLISNNKSEALSDLKQLKDSILKDEVIQAIEEIERKRAGHVR